MNRFLIANTLSFFIKNEEERKKIIKVILPSFFVYFIAGLLNVLTILLLTRKLGAGQFGILTYSFTLITLIASLSTNGINIMAFREPPALLSTGETGFWKGFYLWASKRVLWVSVLVSCLIVIVVLAGVYYFHLPAWQSSPYAIPILFAAASIPFYCLMNYYSSCLLGQHKTVLSFLPDNIIKPLFFLVVLICFFQFNIWNAILVRDLSFVAGFIFAMLMFYKLKKTDTTPPQYKTGEWKASWRSLFLLNAATSLNARLDIIMLGFFMDAAHIGIYNGADKVATSIIIFQAIMNQILSPSISRLHALNDKTGLQNMATKITRWVTIISFPVFILVIIFNKVILSYLGPAFTDGQAALIIICAGQFIGIAFGPLGVFSVVTKNEKITTRFILWKMGVLVLLNIILTPIWGINGAAIATATSIIFWNAGMYVVIKRRTGVSTWIFG